MEKLLDLLQEFYWEDRKFINENWLLTMTNWVVNLSGAYAQTYIISKQGWFIKWLVENDKIDIKALVVKGEMRSWWDFENKKWNEESGEEIWNKYYSELCLMILAIQNKPIEFLISILK